jgi:hypothetical protein
MAAKKKSAPKAAAPKKDPFWSLIDEYRDGDEYDLDGLTDALAAGSKEQIVAFGTRLSELMQESYRGDLWGAAYLANGGCSDDGFDYFRAWLISRGKAAYEAALENPDSIVDEVGEGEVELEELLVVAARAWESKTGKDDYYEQMNDGEEEEDDDEDEDDLDLSWSEDGEGVPEKLEKAYPRLFEKFGDQV